MESIIPSYPEGWLAVHHSLGSMAEAWGVMAVFAQPGCSLEVCRDSKDTFLINARLLIKTVFILIYFLGLL